MYKSLMVAAGLAMATAGTAALAEEMPKAQKMMGKMVENTAVHTVGDLSVTGAFSRATLPNAPVAGGFMKITNNGTEDDRLIGAASVVAGHGEIHEMKVEDEVMRMRELEDGLVIPAGETVILKPGGYHVMLMELKEPLIEGEMVNVTVTFDKAGSLEVPLMIGAPNAGKMHKMKNGGMKKKPAVTN